MTGTVTLDRFCRRAGDPAMTRISQQQVECTRHSRDSRIKQFFQVTATFGAKARFCRAAGKTALAATHAGKTAFEI